MLILSCYKDTAILKAYKKLQDEKSDLYNDLSDISNHLILLSQKDLALTLWKIYCDTDENANTISKFRNSINKLLRDNGCECQQVKKEKIDKSIENKLKKMRHKFLAHTDMRRNNSRIEMCELKEFLDGICTEFNRICDVIDDHRVESISEKKIAWQDMIFYTELLALYNPK